MGAIALLLLLITKPFSILAANMFKFALPWVLFFIPLPWVLRQLLTPLSIEPGNALKIPFYQKIMQLNQGEKPRFNAKKMPFYVACLTWILLVIASSGPQWLGEPLELPRTGRNIMLALDLSGSMQIPDMILNGKATDRLSVVKDVATRFIADRPGDKLGLILFGTRAYLQTPLTFDRTTVLRMLDDATIGLAGPQTAMGDAIGLAIKHLGNKPQKSRVIILLTDGASNAGTLKPLQAAQLAANNNIKIYTIGIGAKQLVVPGFFGAQMINPSADLDEKTLKQIADLTHGLFFRAENTADLRNVYQQIQQLEPLTQDKIVFHPITTFYQWPLVLALILSIYLACRLAKPWLVLSFKR